MLFMVYDKKGTAFEVRPAKAKSLVITGGWSMDKPSKKIAPAAGLVAKPVVPPPVPVVKLEPAPAPAPVAKPTIEEPAPVARNLSNIG